MGLSNNEKNSEEKWYGTQGGLGIIGISKYKSFGEETEEFVKIFNSYSKSKTLSNIDNNVIKLYEFIEQFLQLEQYDVSINNCGYLFLPDDVFVDLFRTVSKIEDIYNLFFGINIRSRFDFKIPYVNIKEDENEEFKVNRNRIGQNVIRREFVHEMLECINVIMRDGMSLYKNSNITIK